MVAGSAAFFLEHGLSASASPSNKCRYKTGKCTNARSSKRNGQPHMLCLYHRDKANKIQRKFDRQKRQSVRMKKSSSAPSSNSGSPRASGRATTMMAGGAASAFAHSMASSASFSGLLAAQHHELDIYSDSDSSRFSTDSEASRLSTDSESGAAASLDLVWQDLPNSALLGELADTLVTPTAVSCGSSAGMRFHGPVGSGSLSHEEIDFLYSAMLE